MAFRGLQAETEKQASVHKSVAHELNALVADPFAEWAKGHRVCPIAIIDQMYPLLQLYTGQIELSSEYFD